MPRSSPALEQQAITRPLRINPWLLRLSVLASNLYLVAAQFSYRQHQGDSPCTTRSIPFSGIGALGTRQCDPILEIMQTQVDANNQTSETSVGLAYFEATAKTYWAGSETQVKVPLECLQDSLFEIVPHVLNSAADANPPLVPFPQNTQPQPCQIDLNDMVITSTNSKGQSTSSRAARHITFNIVPNFNTNLCNSIIDYLNSQTEACQSSNKVSAIDAGKAFFVIGIIIGGSAALFGIGCGGIYCFNACKNVRINRNSFFTASHGNPNALEATHYNARPATDLEGQPQIEMKSL